MRKSSEDHIEEEAETWCACCERRDERLGAPRRAVNGMKTFAILLCFPTTQTSCCSLISWIVGCANFSAQYNYNSITLALLMMEKGHAAVPNWATSALTSVIFLGSVFGQLSLGVLGDAIGRHAGLAITLALIAGGASVSALAWDLEEQPSDAVYLTIICARFALGVGVGGVYPLSAVAAFEDEREDKTAVSSSSSSRSRSRHDAGLTTCASEENAERARGSVRAAWALFWQMPGQLAVYVVALVLISMPSLSWVLRGRVLLLTGAVPALCAMPAALHLSSTPQPSSSSSGTNKPRTPHSRRHEAAWRAASDAYNALARSRVSRHRLLGCSAAWFAFDVYAYGVSVYSPVILEWIFGDEGLRADCWENVLCSVVGFPAVAMSIWALRQIHDGDVARLQVLGFVGGAAALALLAAAWLVGAPKPALFALFVLLRAVMQYGVAVSTFVMAPALFPKSIRSTCNGLAAAAGKAGAILGTFAIAPLAAAASAASVFFLFAAVALGGAAVTLLTLSPAFAANPKQPVENPFLDGTALRPPANNEEQQRLLV